MFSVFLLFQLTDVPFFASRLKLGKNGIEAFVKAELEELTEFEKNALEALKPELNNSIKKGIEFANKEAQAVAV